MSVAAAVLSAAAIIQAAGPTVVLGERLQAEQADASAPDAPPSQVVRPLDVVVTVAPLRSLVEPLLPSGSVVRVLMAPGRSEHGYEFTPQDVAALARADVVVYVGLHLEPRIAKALRERSVPARRVVCFAEIVGLQKPGEPEPNSTIAGEHDDHDHQHGEAAEHGHEHGHGWIDQHLWLDPALVRRLVPALRAAVEGDSPAPAERERAGAAERALVAKIDAVDRAWRDGIGRVRGRAFVTHHDAFGRPAERYGLRVADVIRGSESQEPTPDAVAEVVRAIRKEGVRAIFVEPQFNARTAERIGAAAKVRVGRLDPLGDGDWFKLMDDNLASLVENLKD